jgi:serine phosphatase RsbU (regulator of sigma subunit)/Tfp pilus assembly protein PilF
VKQTNTHENSRLLPHHTHAESELDKLIDTNYRLWALRHTGIGHELDAAKENHLRATNLGSEVATQGQIALAAMNYGLSLWAKSNFDEALPVIELAVNQSRASGDNLIASFGLAFLANINSGKGRYDQAFQAIYEALDLLIDFEGALEERGLTYLVLGSLHFDLEDYDTAYEYNLSSYKEFSAIDDRLGMARATNNAGMSLMKLDRLDEALEFCRKALVLYEELGHQGGVAKALRDLGKVYMAMDLTDLALDFFKRSLNIREKAHASGANQSEGIITCLDDIGATYLRMQQPVLALEFLLKALEIAKAVEALPKQYKIHRRIAWAYKAIGDFGKALEHHELFFELRTSVLGQETANKIKTMQTRYALAMSQQEAKIEKVKNEEINRAYSELHTVNKNITDSLLYSKRIQQAFLPTDETLKAAFEDHFLMFKPRDIVSGDFYWYAEKNGFKVFAVADCTGHGVPGAFMSFIGNSLLERIIIERGILEPTKILQELHKGVLSALLKEANHQTSADGMDIAILIFDPKMTKCYFAGAKRNLYYMQNGKFMEIKGGHYAVGFDLHEAVFMPMQVLDLEDIDWIYVFTDGFADQFGERTNKKYMLSRMKEVLANIHRFSGDKQKALLDFEFKSWMGRNSQTDDVLVAGIKVKGDK